MTFWGQKLIELYIKPLIYAQISVDFFTISTENLLKMTILSSKCSIPSLVDPQTPKKVNLSKKKFFLAYPSKIDLLRQKIFFSIFGRFLVEKWFPKKRGGYQK